MSYHTQMRYFDNSKAADCFIKCITHIRLYQGGEPADAFSKAVKEAAEAKIVSVDELGTYKLTVKEVQEIADRFSVKKVK